MVVQIIDTMPSFRTVMVSFDYSVFSGSVESINLALTNPGAALNSRMKMMGITLDKPVAFNEGVVKFGIGSLSSAREVIGTGAEAAAATAGTVELNAWRTSAIGAAVGLNNYLQISDVVIFARFEGSAAPTSGQAVLYLSIHDVSPRAFL